MSVVLMRREPRSMSTKSETSQDTLKDRRWQSIVARDKQADGSFVYSVKKPQVSTVDRHVRRGWRVRKMFNFIKQVRMRRRRDSVLASVASQRKHLWWNATKKQ